MILYVDSEAPSSNLINGMWVFCFLWIYRCGLTSAAAYMDLWRLQKIGWLKKDAS